jgi:hypothetical protein
MSEPVCLGTADNGIIKCLCGVVIGERVQVPDGYSWAWCIKPSQMELVVMKGLLHTKIRCPGCQSDIIVSGQVVGVGCRGEFGVWQD